MFIQNESLKNVELLCLNGASVIGDPEGIFDVDEETGKMLIQTKGWSESDKAPQKREEIDPVAALKKLREMQGNQPLHAPPAPITASPAAPKAPAPAAPELPAAPEPPAESAPTTPEPLDVPEPPVEPEPSAEPEASASEDTGDEEEGPDLSTKTKAELIQIAAQYEVELPAELKKGKVEKLRAYLDKQLYGE